MSCPYRFRCPVPCRPPQPQTRENSPDGRALIKSYHLDSPAGGPTPSLPVILVVDPLTGAKMWHRSGFVDAEQLMEALVPFLDYGPLDAGECAAG